MAKPNDPHRRVYVTSPLMSGGDIRGIQRHLGVTPDGVYGSATRAALEAWLEVAGGDVRAFAGLGATVKMQRILRGYQKRPAAWACRAALRKARAKRGPQAAVKWAGKWIGRTESPAGSNRAPWGLTAWQQALGSWLVGAAWCGVFVGRALTEAGVKGINSRVAAVVLILEDALAGRNGFARCVYRRSTGSGSVSAGQPGDALGLFSESTHVALVVKRIPGGYRTREGNTSAGPGGSQSNGGGVYERTRSDADVAYIARPKWS